MNRFIVFLLATALILWLVGCENQKPVEPQPQASVQSVPGLSQDAPTTDCPPTEYSNPDVLSKMAATGPCTKNVGILGSYIFPDFVPFLQAAGHTVTLEDAASIAGGALNNLDVLFINRSGVLDANAASALIDAWVRGGGVVITEFDATGLIFNTFSWFTAGPLVVPFGVPSGTVCGGNAVTVVDPGNPLAAGLPPSWPNSGDPIGVFKVYNNLDPSLQIVATVGADQNGDGANDPVVAVGCVDNGAVVAFFTDFADWTSLENPRVSLLCRRTIEDETLLLNAVCNPLNTCIIHVDIDIKPGSDPNSINLKSNGVIPVAVLTTDDFDATTVDGSTVLFEGASPVHGGHLEDVDGDGDLDWLGHFNVQDTDLGLASTTGTLTGQTTEGKSFEGTDDVRIAPGSAKGI